MQVNIPQLEKKAIKLALEERWEEAIKVNKEILKADSKNVKANLRLGRAYLQTQDFPKAQKIFDKVLEIDPINSIAKKNSKLAKERKTQQNTNSNKTLVKEPGTSVECSVALSKHGLNAEDISYGESLEIEVLKTKANISLEGDNIAEITDADVIKRLNKALGQDADVEASFVKGEGKNAKILVTTSVAVFKSDRQDVKPYVRKGAIEEPEIEVESYDDN